MLLGSFLDRGVIIKGDLFVSEFSHGLLVSRAIAVFADILSV